MCLGLFRRQSNASEPSTLRTSHSCTASRSTLESLLNEQAERRADAAFSKVERRINELHHDIHERMNVFFTNKGFDPFPKGWRMLFEALESLEFALDSDARNTIPRCLEPRVFRQNKAKRSLLTKSGVAAPQPQELLDGAIAEIISSLSEIRRVLSEGDFPHASSRSSRAAMAAFKEKKRGIKQDLVPEMRALAQRVSIAARQVSRIRGVVHVQVKRQTSPPPPRCLAAAQRRWDPQHWSDVHPETAVAPPARPPRAHAKHAQATHQTSVPERGRFRNLTQSDIALGAARRHPAARLTKKRACQPRGEGTHLVSYVDAESSAAALARTQAHAKINASAHAYAQADERGARANILSPGFSTRTRSCPTLLGCRDRH